MTKKPENYSDFNVRHKDIICNFAVSYTYPLTYYIKDSIVMKDIRLSRKKIIISVLLLVVVALAGVVGWQLKPASADEMKRCMLVVERTS